MLRSHCQSSWWRRCYGFLFFIGLMILPLEGISNEMNAWQNEIESLKKQLLYSLDCFKKISTLATEQSLKHEKAQRLLSEQKQQLSSSQKKIDYLMSQIKSSGKSSTALLKELDLLQSLQDQAEKQYKELLKAFADYKKEAKRQIDDIRRERDRARKWLRWMPLPIGLAFLAGGILGAWLF